MKTFKFKTQILIICYALIAYGDSALESRIGSDGREYLIEYDEKYTWFQARDECTGRNRELLTIDSAEKQDVISKVLEDKTWWLWLGANNEFNPSGIADPPFLWSATGKQFTYTNWAENYPRNTDNNDHCVLIYLGNKEWINYKCDDKNGFICEEKPKQSLKSSNKNSNNASDVVQKFINEFDLKFQSLLKDNMAELTVKLEDKLANIIENAVQKILDKQELSAKELNHEITNLGSDLSDQLKRSVDELNAKLSERQNFTNPAH